MTDFNDEKKNEQEETRTPKDAYGNHDPDKAAPGGYNVAPGLGPIPGVGEEKDKEDAVKDEADTMQKEQNADKGPQPFKKTMPKEKDEQPQGEPPEDKGGFGGTPDKKVEEKQNDPFLPQDAPVKKSKNLKL